MIVTRATSATIRHPRSRDSATPDEVWETPHASRGDTATFLMLEGAGTRRGPGADFPGRCSVRCKSCMGRSGSLGIATSAPHLGHFPFVPALLRGAASAWSHLHLTLILLSIVGSFLGCSTWAGSGDAVLCWWRCAFVRRRLLWAVRWALRCGRAVTMRVMTKASSNGSQGLTFTTPFYTRNVVSLRGPSRKMRAALDALGPRVCPQRIARARLAL